MQPKFSVGKVAALSLLPACSQPTLLLAAPKSLAWGCDSPMLWSQTMGCSSCGSAVGLTLQGSIVWMGAAGGRMCAELLKHLCVQKPISSSWGNSEVKGYFWRLNCDILNGTEMPVHAPVMCPACHNHVVTSPGGCGQMQQLSSAPDSAGCHTALPARRGRGEGPSGMTWTSSPG